MKKHEEQLKQAVKESVQSITQGDVAGQVSYSQSVSFEQDKLHSIDDVSYTSLFCRIFEKGKVGNAYVNDSSQYQEMIANAKESSLFGEQMVFTLPQAQEYAPIGWLYSEKNLQYNKQDLKDLAQDLLYHIKKFAPKAKVSTGVQNGCSQAYLQNTNGFVGEYETSVLSVSGGLFELGEDGSFIEIYESESFYDNDYNLTTLLTELEERVVRSRRTSVLKKSGKIPVIFAPSAMDLLLSPIEIAVNGKTKYKELSLLANQIEEQIFDKKLTLIDDPFYYQGMSSVPFDDEGTIGKVLPIIENGVFKNFIYDCHYAQKMNAKSTGHASRSSHSLPIPSLTNMIIGVGTHSLEEMIASVDYGLMLIMPLGEGQSNVIAGDFSILAETAYLIENGVLKGRVKDIMLSGNAFELLKKIEMIENKTHQEYSLIAPHLLIDGIMVSHN